MNTLPQKKLLHAVIFDGRLDLVRYVNDAWFFDANLREIYRLSLEAILNKQGGRDGIFEHLASKKLHGNKEMILKAMILECENVGTCDHTIIDILRSDFEKFTHKQLLADLEDEATSTKLITDRIIEASKTLSQNSDGKAIDLQAEVEKYYSEEEDQYTKNILDLGDGAISEIFRGRIYPLLYVILGRPGCGKSRFALEIIQALWHQGYNSRFYSFEDSVQRVRAKWIAMRSNLPFKSVLEKSMDETRTELAKRATINLPSNKGNITIVDKRMRFQDFYREIKSDLMNGSRIDMIFIDYLQLFKYSKNNEVSEIGDIMTGLSELSSEYSVPILILSQPNMRDEKDGAVELHLGAGKGSGAIEETAREYYAIEGQRDDEWKRIKTLKTTVNGFVDKAVCFDAVSGKIHDIKNYNEVRN